MRPALHRRLIAVALATAMVILALILARPVRADTGYAALLVLFGPDDYHTECIPLPGNMTAFDLVRASTLSSTVESIANTPDALCSIDGVGCEYPGEPCFCQCNADACALWTEWYWDVNRWQVAFDADERIIPNGAIEAWVWGDGMSEPPIVAFADICTGAVPDGIPASPTDTPAASTGYPAPLITTPTLWFTPTRPTTVAGASTATPTPTATALGQLPGSLLTPSPSAGTATPAGTRFVTPAWMAPSPTQTLATHTSAPDEALPAPEDEGVAAVPEIPSESPTPDQVAMLIDASAARVRATALAASQQLEQVRRGSAGTWVLGIAAAALVAYALLLQRQRRRDAALVALPPSQESADQTGADQTGAEPGTDDAEQAPGDDPAQEASDSQDAL